MSAAHAWAVRHVTYPVWQLRTRGVVFPALRKLEESQWLDPDALHTLQWTKVQAVLHHAFEHVPLYRRRYVDVGLTPADVRSPEDLRFLPPLEKADLRDRWDELQAAGNRTRLVERKTSGSTGIPVVVWVSPEARDEWSAARIRALRWWNVEVGDRCLTLFSRQARTKSRLVKQFLFANVLEYSAADLSEDTLQRIVCRLADPSVHVLVSYPSTLAYLAGSLEATTTVRSWGLRAVLTTGELLHGDVRALIRRVFRCPVVNEYGTSETGHVAAECPYGRMHIAAENVLVEIDRSRDQVGGEGEILLTDLTNFVMPLIRYRVGDLGSVGEPCPCGRGLPVLTVSAGRREDLVVLPDGRRMDSGVFDIIVDELGRRGVALKQFQVVQHAVDRFEVVLAGSYPDGVPSAVAERIIRALEAPVTVEVRMVPAIPPEPTGKRRRFTSHVAGAR